MIEHQIMIAGQDTTFAHACDDTVLRAALRAGIGFPYECNSGGCGSCKFDLVEGEVENLWPDAPGLTDRDRRNNRLLACQCRAKCALQIKVRPAPEYRPVNPPKRFRAKLLESVDITHDMREFRFVAPGPADFLAGQYAMLSIPGLEAPRAYSMSNISNAQNEWHFQIRLVPNGRATAHLFHHLRAGDEIEIDGPYGLAYLRPDSPRDIVCVGGGSGLAPMVSIARAASQAGMLNSRHLHFFYGARTAQDICGEALLCDLPEFGQRIHFHPVVSQPGEPPQAQWRGETGFVHELVRRVLGEQMTQFEFYFAGPALMTEALQEMLMVRYRVPFEQVHFDRFF